MADGTEPNTRVIEARAEWKIRLVRFLMPHLKGNAAERDGAVNAVLIALDAAHGEGLRQGAAFCRTVAENARRHGDVAQALADGIEAMAERGDVEAAEAARRWQAEP